MSTVQTVQHSITYESPSGYCTYSNTASTDGCRLPNRHKKCKTTPQAVAEINKKNSVEQCKDVVNCNFEPTDYHIVVELPRGMSIMECIDLVEPMFRRLRRLHNRFGLDFVYIYSWGRGENAGQLHIHIAIKKYDDISAEDIKKAITKNGKYSLIVNYKPIRNYPIYTTDQQVYALNEFAKYFCKNYDELTDEDRKIIKKRWYPCQGLQHTAKGNTTITQSDEYDRPIGGNPKKQNKELIKAYKNGTLDDKTFNRILGYRNKTVYHVIQDTIRLIKDDYGNTNIYMQMIKLGSEIDVKYNPQRAKHKEYIRFYKPKIVNGIDFGLFKCNWEMIPI